MSWHKRLLRDIEELRNAGFQIQSEDGKSELTNFETFVTVLQGPKDTPYFGGSWKIRFTFTTMYPFTSPSVGFVDKILHPNVDWASGTICLDALNKKWSPVFSLKHIMESLLPYLLIYPNPNDPLNRDAASMYLDNKEMYNTKVIECVNQHAKAAK